MINNFFQDAGKRLGMKGDVEKSSFPEYSGPVENIIRKLNGHSSTKKMKKLNTSLIFYFSTAEPADVKKEIKSLNISKV